MPRTASLLATALLLSLVASVESAAEPDETLTAQQRLENRRKEVEAMAPASFTVLTEFPFIVAGDEDSATVRKRARETIRPAVEHLKQDFFAKNPHDVIAIWLFKDRASYESGTRTLFSENHVSPYGYYLPRHRVLLMNIATGSGTLVHEIVHPFMRTNFPACPPWFDEGLASLFEAPAFRDGHMVGLVNWRLPGLQTTIRNGRTLPFAELLALTSSEFYGPSEGYNRYYGQSRYLCYYLQEQGLLQKFYREFVVNAATDPTGAATLRAVLGEDLDLFQARWESFVLNLPSP